MVTRFRVLIASVLLVIGVAGVALAANALTKGFTGRPSTKVAALTVPIIKDPGTGELASGPLVAPVSRAQTQAGTRVRIADLGIDLPIVEGDGQNVPLFKAAHYPGMLWPGQGGRSLLYAHARPGMFGPLFSAKVGQRIEIETADGRVLRYAIKLFYPLWPDRDLSILQPSDREQLVLLTCTSWTASDPKIIAIAEPVK